MEFPDLGKHCQNPNCHQADFLPLECDCGKIFCRVHFNEHSIGDCELTPKSKDVRLVTDDVLFKCYRNGCKVATLHEILCPKCSKHFCIAHRFHPECPEVDLELADKERKRKENQKEYIIKTDINLQAKITEKIREALQTPKAKTAMKIHLMRVKQKANGPKNISVTDRVYFSINKPKDNNFKCVTKIENAESLQSIPSINYDVDLQNSVPVFICKTWTIGRNLDSICETCNIINENNKQTDKKVRLFRYMDGYGIKKLDVTLDEMLKNNILAEGDRLLVEYIDKNDLLDLKDHTEIVIKLPVEIKV